MTGTIKRLIADRGFAFATPDEGGADIFVHASSLPKGQFETLAEGSRISYDVIVRLAKDGEMKPRAANVQIL